MKYAVILGVCLVCLFSCVRRDTVLIGGRIENGDSIVAIWIKDSVYTFPLDENNFFSGKIVLKKGIYASFMPNSFDLYLSPGENLEIYANASNMLGTISFKGSLGGINSYLREQEMMVFFDRDDYLLEEQKFVAKMKGVMEEKVKLLEAKNFNKDFTDLEKERIRYAVGEYMTVYPVYHRQLSSDTAYEPGRMLRDFLAGFPIDREELFVTKNYRKFLLNYVYFQKGEYEGGKNYAAGLAGYILSHFRDADIRNFLLTEVVYRYIWENNGLEGAEDMLNVFYQKCTDRRKIAYIDELVGRWKKLRPGYEAAAFRSLSVTEEEINLSDYRGTYVYLGIWATWCVPCKKELAYFAGLVKDYQGKNIRFVTVSVDGPEERQNWLKLLDQKQYKGIHTLALEKGKFCEDYMIISIPRFILIDPEGKIKTSNAPRPSGQLRMYLNSLDL